jgi:16S rRNA processing protein RimM
MILKLKRKKKNRIALSKKNLIEIGSFVGAHGIKGEVKLKSFTEIPENIFSFREIFIESSENPVKLKLIRKLKQTFVCKIENIETRTDAENFKGLKLFITRKSLPKLTNEEFYHSDLLNFEVYNLNKESFGKVIFLEDFGAGLLIEVKKNNKTFYLPMGKNFLSKIDYKDKQIILDLEKDLIEN